MASLIFNICVVLSWLIANYLMHNQLLQRPHRVFKYIQLHLTPGILQLLIHWLQLTELKMAGRDNFNAKPVHHHVQKPQGRGMKYFSFNANSLFVMSEFNCFDRLWSFCVCNEGPQSALYSCGGVCIVCPGGRMDYLVDNSFFMIIDFSLTKSIHSAKTGSDFPLIIHQLFFNALCGSC